MTVEIEETEINPDEEWARLEQSAQDLDGILSPELPSVENSEPEQTGLETGELLAQAIQASADIFAPNWHIEPEESEQLGIAYGALLDKYMPDSGLDKYGIELSAILITGMVLKSRAGVPLKKPKPKKDKSEEKPEHKGSAVEFPTELVAKPVNGGGE
jgi:hypothetical protein